MQRPISTHWAIVTVILLALAVRLYGIDWGLPHVYEEAEPLKRAWHMWGWGPDESFDPNPHFFNYPSLTFYAQFGGQAALYAGMRSTGAVSSTEDFRVRYHTAPSPFYVLGRLINVAFGVLTVFLLFLIGRRIGGRTAALVAAVLFAVCLFHVARSQMVEVDVPLTFFVVLALGALLRLVAAPTRWGYVVAGAAIGLAAATKYTGALLVIPLVAAHLAARRSPDVRAGWRWLFLAAAACGAAFLLTSPYVALDFRSFWADFSAERNHMRLGHFGVDARSGWLFYSLVLGRAAGWPVVALAAVGLAHSLVVRREAWSIVVAAFVVPYALAISSWAMAADRYALPLLPFVYLYAAVGLSFLVVLVPSKPRWRTAATAAALIVLLAPVSAGLPRHLKRYEVDSRTVCLERIERNVPAGSLIVSEAYGPPVVGPVEYWAWPGDIRERIYEAVRERPFYASFAIPMFQVEPEQTAAFYDLRLYREADVLVTTGAVRTRYLADRERFPRQAAFYENLSSMFDEVERIEPGGTGSSIVVYRRRPLRPPFSERSVQPPPPIRPDVELRAHWRGIFYYRMALNYEAWNHLDQAIAGYVMALPFAEGDSELFRSGTFGLTRCFALTGETERALEIIERMKAHAPTDADLRFLEGLEDGVHNLQN